MAIYSPALAQLECWLLDACQVSKAKDGKRQRNTLNTRRQLNRSAEPAKGSSNVPADPSNDGGGAWLSEADMAVICGRRERIKQSRASNPEIDVELKRLIASAKDLSVAIVFLKSWRWLMQRFSVSPTVRPWAINRNIQASQSKRKAAGTHGLPASGSGDAK